VQPGGAAKCTNAFCVSLVGEESTLEPAACSREERELRELLARRREAAIDDREIVEELLPPSDDRARWIDQQARYRPELREMRAASGATHKGVTLFDGAAASGASAEIAEERIHFVVAVRAQRRPIGGSRASGLRTGHAKQLARLRYDAPCRSQTGRKPRRAASLVRVFKDTFAVGGPAFVQIPSILHVL
jgi:hypothetical protein